MPLLEIALVGEAPAPPCLARRLADDAGAALESRPGGTWVRLRMLDPSLYAENGGQPAGAQPVFVRLVMRERPTGAAFAALVARLTTAVAEACARPRENVHLLVDADARGRIAFGGQVVD